MKTEDFEQLKEYIMEKNPYFNTGYANAYKDGELQCVVSKNGKDIKRLFPLDTQGNYFYLRNETTIRHEPGYDERLTDTGPQRLSFRDTMTCYLVAVIRDADVCTVLANLKNTVMMYPDMNVQPVTSIWNREQVLREEMAGMKKESLNAALQRLKDETIVRITLHVSKMFIPGNCINEI